MLRSTAGYISGSGCGAAALRAAGTELLRTLEASCSPACGTLGARCSVTLPGGGVSCPVAVVPGAEAASRSDAEAIPAASRSSPPLPSASSTSLEWARSFASGAAPLAPGQPAPGSQLRTFYKRKLPSPPATAFHSPEGKTLFKEALMGGTMEGFFKLIEQFRTQNEPAYCGLTSLVMVLNALTIDPRRTWKGAWRWFDEDLLDCCKPLDEVRRVGVTLDEVASLGACNGAKVTLNRFGTFTEDHFRRQIINACTTGEEHVIASYARKTFGQTGDGHFAPVGGYHEGSDQVLVLDTACFKYPPHWVPLPMLYQAMEASDSVTGLSRGFLRLTAHQQQSSCLFTLAVKHSGWRDVHSYVTDDLRRIAREAVGRSASGPEVLRALAAAAPSAALETTLAMRKPACLSPGGTCGADALSAARCAGYASAQHLLREMGASALVGVLTGADSAREAAESAWAARPFEAERAAVLLWLHADAVQQGLQEGARDAGTPEAAAIAAAAAEPLDLTGERMRMVRTEVEYLALQLSQLSVLRELPSDAEGQLCCTVYNCGGDGNGTARGAPKERSPERSKPSTESSFPLGPSSASGPSGSLDSASHAEVMSHDGGSHGVSHAEGARTDVRRVSTREGVGRTAASTWAFGPGAGGGDVDPREDRRASASASGSEAGAAAAASGSDADVVGGECGTGEASWREAWGQRGAGTQVAAMS